jgi:hypothetical protein
VLGDLTAGAQPGLRFVAGARLGPEDPGINRVVDTASYAVGIPRLALPSADGEGWLTERIATALEAKELPVVRRIDGIGKRVDVRDFLRAIAPADAARVSLGRAGLVGDLVGLSVEVDVRGSGGVKIAEVTEAVFGADLPARAVRVALAKRLPSGELASPVQLDALRKPRTHASAEEAPAGEAAV